ncbi:hypothetical protein HFV01_03735 [Limnospira fusiformis SAG 85.79]|uniref:Uncharacterized protein n=1 Tax=Limnospira maxima CS-328 TaxID=513049 RepID=B5VYW9_LIMMA|nr:hypothetical protein AmaxDRAFT_1711 [Limnospira maxima CS-328]QJB25078.1 hypothetical protein HFV01_03735 [Limnospira fusiformis SAG 85.79]
MGIPSLDLSYPPGYFKGLCRCFIENPTFPLTLLSAAYQPVSLRIDDDGSSRTFGFPNHGWLAVVASGSGFYFTPSVPRFNPGVMIPKTGGGYRRYSQRNC